MSNQCPRCGSGEIEIDDWFDFKKRQTQYQLKCRDCGYEKTLNGNMAFKLAYEKEKGA